MNTDVYSQFINITQIDSSAVKSIFMHLNSVTSKINNLKFNSIVLSLKNDSDLTLVYEIEKGKRIPTTIFNSLKMLFSNPEYLTSDISITVELTYIDKIYHIIYDFGLLKFPEELAFLFSSSNYFNFFTSIHNNKSNLDLFESLFEFMIKKELPAEAENIFKIQFDKHYSGITNEETTDSDAKNVDNEILIEKLLKTKNDIFARINKLTQETSSLSEEKEKLVDYVQNKEKYSLKYESLKNDYKLLIDQSKTYFKNVNDLKDVIDKITQELANVQIHLEMSNLPPAEQTKIIEEKDFLIDKKLTFTAALTEAETNFANLNNLIQSTKSNMEATYNDLDIINHTTLTDTDSYDKTVHINKKEIEDLYMQVSDIDIELNKLQKENANFNLTREYAELKNKGTDDIEYSSLKTSLNTAILPVSINIVYKYLLNLFLYHTSKNSSEGLLTIPILAEFSIFPQTFFTKYNNDEVIIS